MSETVSAIAVQIVIHNSPFDDVEFHDIYESTLGQYAPKPEHVDVPSDLLALLGTDFDYEGAVGVRHKGHVQLTGNHALLGDYWLSEFGNINVEEAVTLVGNVIADAPKPHGFISLEVYTGEENLPVAFVWVDDLSEFVATDRETLATNLQAQLDMAFAVEREDL